MVVLRPFTAQTARTQPPGALMKRTLLILVALGLAGVVTFRALFGGPTWRWHQKLTVTVETPAGEVSGSSVTEMVVVSLPKTLPDAGVVDAQLYGEAVVVEVLPHRYLFALLGGGLGWAQAAYDKNQVGSVFEENMRFIVAQKGGPAVPLPKESWPLLVTFDDVSDSKTVRQVDPDDLAASFGPGVSLKNLTLEITGDPVTKGRVEALLGWLGIYPETRLFSEIRSTDFSIEAQLEQGDFIRSKP